MAVKKVERRGQAVWRARVKVGGRIATAYRSRKDSAVAAESELRERLENEARAAATGLPTWGGKVPTLAAFHDAFIADAEARNGAAEVKHKKQHMRDHLLDAFGGIRLDQISTKLIDAFVAVKLKSLSPSTVDKLVSTLRRALGLAREWEVIQRLPKFRRVKVEAPEFDYMDFEECDRFLENSGSWRTFMLTAVRTGLRLGELRGLQWRDVDLAQRRIRVSRAFTQTGWGTPKSGKGRTVDLAHDVAAALAQLKPAGAPRTALVFPGPSGAPLDEKAAYKACVAASKTAELGRVIGPHKLRHTFASHHAMRGTPLPVIQEWLGHAHITTTMRYAHLAPSMRASFADAVALPQRPRVIVDNVRDTRGVTTGVTKRNGASKSAVR